MNFVPCGKLRVFFPSLISHLIMQRLGEFLLFTF